MTTKWLQVMTTSLKRSIYSHNINDNTWPFLFNVSAELIASTFITDMHMAVINIKIGIEHRMLGEFVLHDYCLCIYSVWLDWFGPKLIQNINKVVCVSVVQVVKITAVKSYNIQRQQYLMIPTAIFQVRRTSNQFIISTCCCWIVNKSTDIYTIALKFKISL